jgi:dihydrofolate synthase / folylpolyglutamate synthase
MPRPRPAEHWTVEDAERWLLSLELFGMRFGLNRMRRLMTTLGNPHERFRAVHVVGTNGKSSTTRMTAAILARHGVRTGAYLSPHLVSFAERILIDGADVAGDAFARACSRAKHAADLVNRTGSEDDRVTQFEALTAAAFSELAEQGVEVAVVEAGLGGRYDATNVLHAEVAVLTNVGLEHTRVLGPTITHIAREKLAVVEPRATLVVGAQLDPAAELEAEETAIRQDARMVHAERDTDVPLLAQGAFQRGNFATARAAAEALIGPLDEVAVREAAASTLVPGRFEVVADRPVVVLDGAHNEGGIQALAATLPAWLRGRRLVAVISVLDDKDAAAMLGALLPLCDGVVFTANANPRALSPATLQSLAGQLDGPPAHVEADPRRALQVAKRIAGEEGVVLATGSIYLIADLLRPPGRRGATI